MSTRAKFRHKKEPKDILFRPLPDYMLEQSIGFSNEAKQNSAEEQENYIMSRLPQSDHDNFKKVFGKKLLLSKAGLKATKRQEQKVIRGESKSPGSALRKSNLATSNLTLKDVIPIHEMWLDYIHHYIGNVHHKTEEELSILIWKADFQGAHVAVVKSTSPNLVGIEGIVILETRNTFHIINYKDQTKVVPKKPCEFKIVGRQFELNFLGENLLLRPVERAKKYKPVRCFQL